MTDQEFNAFVKSLPRELSEEDVHQVEIVKDIERGAFAQEIHHQYGEAGQQ